MKKKPIWAICFGLALVGYTVYVMLNVFVIRQTMQTNATEMNMSMFENITPLVIPQEKEETATDTEGVVTESVTGTEGTTEGTTETEELTGTVTEELTETEGATETGADSLTVTPTSTPEATNTPTPTKKPTATPTPYKQPGTVLQQPEAHYTDKEVITENSYSNDHISITITTYREFNTDIHVADVYVTSAQYIKTAFAEDTYGRNIFQTTSKMAKAKGAIFAVNGDDYGAREGGYLIRNGVSYREVGNTKKNTLSLLADGNFLISTYSKYSPSQLVKMGAWQAWTFGPTLVSGGEIKVTTNQEVDLALAKNQRTAIGLIEPLHYIFVVSDGRTKANAGLSLYQLADFMKRYGVKTAFNLDGGGSSTMYFNGKIINQPTGDGSKIYEREISDIIYVK